ncbi:glycosyl hydrolase family 18 protein [Streptomyces sp. NBC_01077]|uniref:glycosyl hydrolase family 18 protein n=1 Tax=Streptomyces sp. NBC_01077 TaxID=2903746 RepID=UPI00386EB1FE|nr:glycosyl hydrolase family 18 protein [Streptomyces sp. NBC_01077]
MRRRIPGASSRPDLHGLRQLALLAALSVLAGLLALVPAAGPARAADGGGKRVVSWNMNMGASDKWRDEIPRLLAGTQTGQPVGGEPRPANILMLQEHTDLGVPNGMGSTVADVRQFFAAGNRRGSADGITLSMVPDGTRFRDITTATTVAQVNFRWQPQGGGPTYYVYMIDAANDHRARVIITDTEATAVDVLPAVIPPGGPTDPDGQLLWRSANSPRPAFGIQVEGVWYYTIHADNATSPDAAGRRRNDASVLIQAITAAVPTQPVFVAGDFNITPQQFLGNTDLGADERLVTAGQPTYFPRNGGANQEYDFGVAGRIDADATEPGARVIGDPNRLDHRPVAFNIVPVATQDDATQTVSTLMHRRDGQYMGDRDGTVDEGQLDRLGAFWQAGNSTVRRSGRLYRQLQAGGAGGRRCLTALGSGRATEAAGSAADSPEIAVTGCDSGTPSDAQLWRFDVNGNLFNISDRAVVTDHTGPLHLGPPGTEPANDSDQPVASPWRHCVWEKKDHAPGALWEYVPLRCDDEDPLPPGVSLQAPGSADVFQQSEGRPLFITNVANGEKLRPVNRGSAWAHTWRQESGLGLERWLWDTSTTPARLINAFHRKVLHGDGGTNWQWATIDNGKEGWEWRVRDSGEPDGSAVFEARDGDAVLCMAQSSTSAKHWVSFDRCDGADPKQRWYVTLATVPPRDPESGGDGEVSGHLESAVDGLVADVDQADPTPGTRVKAKEGKDHPAQTWTLESSPHGWRIRSALDGGPVLAHETEGHEAVLAEATDADPDQRWQIEDAGDGWATVRGDGRCLTAAGADVTLRLDACEADSAAQQWRAPGLQADPESTPEPATGWLKGLDDRCLEVAGDADTDGTPVRLGGCAAGAARTWQLTESGTVEALGKCLDADHSGTGYRTKVQLWVCNDSPAQKWVRTADRGLRNVNAGLCLDVPDSVSGDGRQLQLWGCNASPAQQWTVTPPTGADPRPDGDAGDPFDASPEDRGTKPPVSGDCRPEGMAATEGVATRYCDVYDTDGREWVGNGRTRRVVGYFTGWRTGAGGDPKYLVSNIPWSKVSHINYAFARVEDDRISIGDPADPKNPATGMTWPGEKNRMDPALPYQGHFNLLNGYKKKHPAVKTLISVGGWADTRNFYAMATNADGSVNRAGIDTFADSVTAFLDRYGFNGVDIDYEYPTALPNTGNPADWDVSDPRRKGLTAGYNSLMKTLREKLDRAGAEKGRYYLLTSAGSGSGYLLRGLDAGQALQYQDFVNVMTYDLHGAWNSYVGPQAPLYDDGRDNELAAAGIYDDQGANTKDFQKHGYFNVDWAYHYYRGALPPGRINLGIPYYSRGWRDVQGGTDGLWGTAAMPDQANCPRGTGGRGPANAQACGRGAVGIDNIWHDTEDGREVASGSNPLWHTKNLQAGVSPGYLRSYGVDPGSATGRLTGTYAEQYGDALQASWLWNSSKKVFLSTENERSVDAKASYIADRGIGGAMIWELAGDYTLRAGGEWGMGYDLTARLDQALRGSAAYGNAKAGGRAQPREVIDVTAELVDFPTGENDFYPVRPKLRITNNSGVTLAQGTEIALDLPTSTPPNIKDGNYKAITTLTPGHTGPNEGGLKGDFHRLTFTLGYCEDLPSGRSQDIDLAYYLPITGPANVTFTIGGRQYGSTGDRRREIDAVSPSAPTAGSACQAPEWKQGQVYRPDGGRLWRMYDKGGKGWMLEYGDSPAGRPMMVDHYPAENRAHLVELMEDNPNQYWSFTSVGESLYRVSSGELCLTATSGRQDVASQGCDGRAEQTWQLVPVNDDGSEAAPSSPRHNGLFKLRSRTGGHDLEVSGGSTDRGTRLLSGDLTASTAAFVTYQGFRWYAQWYTTAVPGTAEANGGRPWKKLGPTS